MFRRNWTVLRNIEIDIPMRAALFAAMLIPTSYVAATDVDNKVIAPPSCREAVARSRMICLSGDTCQKEIGPVLRACDRSDAASCVAAREELRNYCGKTLPWNGSRDCDGALRQVGDYCGR